MPLNHPAEDLRLHVAMVLRASGSSQTEATTVAENLVEANLCCHDSHGVGMLLAYVEGAS